jgi:hypothetical protein
MKHALLQQLRSSDATTYKVLRTLIHRYDTTSVLGRNGLASIVIDPISSKSKAIDDVK